MLTSLPLSLSAFFSFSLCVYVCICMYVCVSFLCLRRNCESHRIPNSEYIDWVSTRQNRMRPVTFRPNGSFKALVDAGKLTLETDSMQGNRRRAPAARRQYMPGYTGFVRGSQHISGRTFGETTRRAIDTDYREHVCTSPIPSDPENNRKIRQNQPPTSFVTHQFAGKVYHVPGYTGFVPGMRATYSRTYGSASMQELYKHSLGHPRMPSNVPHGYADSMRPRQL